MNYVTFNNHFIRVFHCRLLEISDGTKRERRDRSGECSVIIIMTTINLYSRTRAFPADKPQRVTLPIGSCFFQWLIDSWRYIPSSTIPLFQSFEQVSLLISFFQNIPILFFLICQFLVINLVNSIFLPNSIQVPFKFPILIFSFSLLLVLFLVPQRIPSKITPHPHIRWAQS